MRFKLDIENIPALYEQEHKAVPYTVTPIGGIPEHKIWKAKRTEIEEAFKTSEVERLKRVAASMDSGELLVKEYKETATTQAWKRYHDNLAEAKKNYEARQKLDSIIARPKEYVAKLSLIDKALIYFMNVKF